MISGKLLMLTLLQEGRTAIMHAAWAGNTEMGWYLLSVGANAATRDAKVRCSTY